MFSFCCHRLFSAGLSLCSIIFIMIAIGTNHWRVTQDKEKYYHDGFWTNCENFNNFMNCSNNKYADKVMVNGIKSTIQASLLLGTMLEISSLIMNMFMHCLNQHIPLFLLTINTISVVFSAFAVIMFPFKFITTPWKIGWSWIIAFVGVLIMSSELVYSIRFIVCHHQRSVKTAQKKKKRQHNWK